MTFFCGGGGVLLIFYWVCTLGAIFRGLSSKDVGDIVDGWCNMMKRAQAKVLEVGGFDWRMFSPGAGTCSGPPFSAGAIRGGPMTCAGYMRDQCSTGKNATLQESAMMYVHAP